MSPQLRPAGLRAFLRFTIVLRIDEVHDGLVDADGALDLIEQDWRKILNLLAKKKIVVKYELLKDELKRNFLDEIVDAHFQQN